MNASKPQHEPTYRIILEGVQGQTAIDEVARKLAARFSGTLEQMRHVLLVPGYVLKKGLAKGDADVYRNELEKCGAKSSVEEEITTLEVDLPDVVNASTTFRISGSAEEKHDEELVRRLADYQKFSSIFWVGLGVLQLISVYGAVAGGWNIVNGVLGFRIVGRIRKRYADAPQAFEPIWPLALIGIINVLLGGIVGIAFVAFDAYIRDKILSNRYLFNATDPTKPNEKPAASETDAITRWSRSDISFNEPLTFPAKTTVYDAAGKRLAILPDYSVVMDDGGAVISFPSATDYREWARDTSQWEVIRQF